MNTKIDSPKIPKDLPVLLHKIHSIQSKDEFSLGSISDAIIEYQEASKVSFEKVVFKNVTITESSLTGIEFTDVVFDRCDISNVDFSDAFIHRTEFRGCKMIGTNFTRARFKNVLFVGCVCDFATFRFGDFKQVAFEDSSLMSTDYFQSVLHKTLFSVCNMDQAILSGSKLKGIDLSDCEFSGLIVEIEDLYGCIISAQQAASFTGLLGLVIK